ncbi:MAG: site-specific integrase [Sulfuritalea sp.]|nr:site-specific integrase [Sulfuritalea sp.]
MTRTYARNLPRGIQVVQWKNADGMKSIRFRVRIVRKDYKADRYFDSQDEAIEFLATAKSRTGRAELAKKEEQQSRAKLALRAFQMSPTLTFYLDAYSAKYGQAPEGATAVQKRNAKSLEYQLKSIKATEVPNRAAYPVETGTMRTLLTFPKKQFGQFKIEEIDAKTASDFIDERLKSVSPASVQRQVNILQSFFNKLRFIDPEADAKLSENPFQKADKSRLKGANKKRDVRLEDFGEQAEEKLLAELSKCQNPQMGQIVALTLATGMRRSEVLFLEWERVRLSQNHLVLDVTKTTPRRVYLTDEAKAVLEAIKPSGTPSGRLFAYTLEGFSTNWQRVVVRAKLQGFRFHDLRREFISRLVEMLASPSALAVSETMGLTDVRHVQKQYLEPEQTRRIFRGGVKTETDLMKVVGHTTAQTTKRYTSIRKR